MGIDELAKAVREGQADILSLWEELRRFAYSRAVRWSGADIEDFMQAAFLALLDTLRRWEPEGGTIYRSICLAAQDGLLRGLWRQISQAEPRPAPQRRIN